MSSEMPHGLSQSEAARRLAVDGPNVLVAESRHTWLRDLSVVMRQPILLLMFGACVLYLMVGSALDAAALLASVFVVVGLSLYQLRKTERAVHALEDLTAPLAHVIRDGRERSLPTHELVRGDALLLREGDRIAADATLVDSANLRLDESMLTGESVHVDKLPRDRDARRMPDARVEDDDTNAVYAGTLAVRGTGTAIVTETGARTKLGCIGGSLRETDVRKSVLGEEVARFVRRIAVASLALCVLLVLAYGVFEHDFMRGLLAGITLAIAILPQEFPVVLTMFTLLGAFRIAKLGVLARRPEAIEALGAAHVLCVDKTGTITENKMRVAVLCGADGNSLAIDRELPSALPEHLHEVLEHGILASASPAHDPMEQALHALGNASLRGTEHLHRDFTREQEYPLTRSLLAVTHLWRTAEHHGHVAASKGAPEAIADLCHLDAERTERALVQASKLATLGLRVLAVARATPPSDLHPEHQHAFDFEWLGLIGFEDPIRASVPAAMQAFARAGVRVVMITGDHIATAKAIAETAGIDTEQGVLTGEAFAALDAGARQQTARRVSVFARAAPEHKLMIVDALAADGSVVAMTGDGVNDAPALKAAHIGIAIGASGTDVAREAAALVLTNPDFGVIAHAIVLGRRVLSNLRKAVAYILAVHVPIAGMAMLPVLFGLPPMLFPIHVLFLELVIDPACSIALEAEPAREESLSAAPQLRGGRLFDRSVLVSSVVQGSVLLCAVAAVYVFGSRSENTAEQARAAAFITLVVGNVLLIQVQRSSTRSALSSVLHSHNVAAGVVSGCALLALALSVWFPPARRLFHFDAPSLPTTALAVAAAAISVLWYDVFKWLRAQRTPAS